MPKHVFIAVATAVALVSGVGSARAQSVQTFYQGKTVTVLIGFGAGGGSDAWARTVGEYIGRHIPGTPAVVPQNMPGAAGLKMTNFIYNAAPKDGTVFGLTNAGIPVEPLLGGKGVNFDPLKVNWIGSPAMDTTVCVARADSPVRTMDDLMTKELVVGASGSGGNTNIYPMYFANAFGMKFRVIKGYKGTRDILLALEQGEVMGICSSYDPLTRRSLYKQGKLRILFQASMRKDKAIDAPLPTKYVKTEEQRKALAFFLARRELGRPFLAPPGVPKERVQALRRAFDATMKDPAFIAQAKKRHFKLDPTTGEDLAAVVEDIYRTPKEAVRLTATALGRKLK